MIYVHMHVDKDAVPLRTPQTIPLLQPVSSYQHMPGLPTVCVCVRAMKQTPQRVFWHVLVYIRYTDVYGV